MIASLAADHTPYDEWEARTCRLKVFESLVTGGTGSLGQTVVRRLLAGELGNPGKITVFSRDEAKQHYMRLSFLHRSEATDDVIYRNSQRALSFRVGDVRDAAALGGALREADIVIHAAALKQVPTCEYFPAEAVMTNVLGAVNLVGVSSATEARRSKQSSAFRRTRPASRSTSWG